MQTPNELLYAASHEWILFADDGSAKVGLTDFAQHALGDIVFVNLPEVGTRVAVGESVGDVESVKAVSDIYSPLAGVIVAVNEALMDAPESLNGDPYGAWLFEVGEIEGKAELLSAVAYDAFCEEAK
ncbi:MAG: glycine cleavage system protein GcvH [Clostridiales bacterium]|nr:glycine cleavage system protein GcvH [Clostridiales bacterium]